MNHFSRYLAPAVFGGALLAGTSLALAQDTDAVLERLQALLAEQAIDVDWQSADRDGDRILLTGVTAGGPDGETEIGDIELSGISEMPDGYRIEAMTMDSYVFDEDEHTMEIDGVVLTGVVLPHEGAGEAYGGVFFYETATVAELRATMDGEEVFLLNNLNVTVTPISDGQPMTFSGGAESFEADLSAVEDDDASDMIERLGYERITGRLDTAGSWEPEEGRLAFSRFDLTIDQGGTLGFAFDIGGYTTEFVRALGELQRNMDDDASDAAGGMAMLGLMQQLSLHGADIYFHDDSLTERVLAIFAEDQGMRPQDVANQARAVLPFLLAQAGAPQLGTMVADAVGQFLDNPQSIRISARPAQGVPFAMLMAGAMASPQALADQIGLEVVAND